MTSTKCFNCKEHGHIARDCTSRSAGSNRSKALCYKCSKAGHLARDCKESEKVKLCSICAKFGHINKECTERRGGREVTGGREESRAEKIDSMSEIETAIDNYFEYVLGTTIPKVYDRPICPEEEKRARKELKKILKDKRKRNGCEMTNNQYKKVKLNYELDFEEKSLCDGISEVTCHRVTTEGSCVHEVALPAGKQYMALENNFAKAKTYSFPLDDFQKQATLCIENNQSVLVSAHTSAGKTVVAEYAIAMCLKNNQRVIYTTPIKALSNQKFRDFTLEFEDVGLMTGDTTINESASCLVMTTEILRTMLFEGADIISEVGWVIFDEIHYMTDKERGYVWEETIIMLSSSVKFVFLSATVPNARQFAKWICLTHDQPCHVVYTETRPTPLEHFIYPANRQEMFLIVDRNGKFKTENFNSAMTSLQKGPETANVTLKGEGRANAKLDCYRLVKMIMVNSLQPAIVFSFSKKECEVYAEQALKMTFTDKAEEKLIDVVVKNALELLSLENRNLKCIQTYIPYLKKGIGIHHGGLLPVIKELTELLFGEGLVKVLFATETFAMGLNMPARSVLFTSLEKFDGKIFRSITSGEYIQMSGRAGRRGKDDRGTVIMKVDDKVNSTVIKNLLKGKADPINSAFHITYNMVLNTIRCASSNPEYILRRSFFQFQNYVNIPSILSDIEERIKKIKSIKIKNLKSIQTYYKISEKLKGLYNERHAHIMQSKRFKSLLVPGRLVKVIHNGLNFGWCVLLDSSVEARRTTGSVPVKDMLFILFKVSQSPNTSSINKSVVRDIISLTPNKENTTGYPAIATIPNDSVWEISTQKIVLPGDMQTSLANRKIGLKLIEKKVADCASDNFMVDPVKHLALKHKDFLKILKDIEFTNRALKSYPVHTAQNRSELLEKAKTLTETQLEIDGLKEKLDETKGIAQMSELKHRKRVLLKLGFLTETNVVTMKGSLACELATGNELLLVEMIFDGQFKELNAAECCGLLSAFVCTDKTNTPPKLKPKLAAALNQLQDTARRIGKVLWFCRLNDDVESYVDEFRPALMAVVYYWCIGRPFSHICKKTPIFAGNIVRMMRRLDMLLRRMIQATQIVGMVELSNTFSEGIKLLKRDIVAMESLYSI